ncbi:Methyltransferase domain-containing protein [Marinospirillum celere]|uniref:Methyltransferase domain-containing protein n=1 Tax=Marinospirillum celere TaxID=1122252 RepID=A0A1I1GRU5_9GAMM|nr:class I SAM-dependent methyltransferase [Marinospirillum celere]SFC14185.1 Methyltransferase domain-containing protein [Marinospirillum celere]
MSNKKASEFYSKLSNTIKDPIETRNKSKDTTPYDVKLISEFAHKSKTLLDLGSGSGLIVNKVFKLFKKTVAIEKQPGISQFIKKNEKIKVVNADLLELRDQKFDDISLITAFGVMNYFTKDESLTIYRRCFEILKPEGFIIIKNQMGVKHDVTIDGWSEELNAKYFSQYRSLSNEIKILESCGFKAIKTMDPYPEDFNRWKDTKFKAIIAGK